MPTANYTLAINIKGTSDTKGIQNASKEVDNFGKRFNTTLGVIKNSAAAALAAGATFKKAFDLAQEGANITQLGESFDLLNANVLHTPDLLNEMRDAVKGTVTDTDLMQGVLKLTAGATDEMAQRFAEAAPQLLEISRAAGKLNPTLGDTSFLYDSISTGIKRASPLILDNLGIVVKVGEANENYAKKLGVTVDQLTAEEKQTALLNATLEAGSKLVEQVGGNTDSASDSYQRFTVKVETLTDRFKQWLAEGLDPTITGLVNLADAAEKNGASGLEVFNTALQEIDPHTKAFNQNAEYMREVHGLVKDAVGETTNKMKDFKGGLELTNAEWGAWQARMEQVIPAMEELTEITDEEREAMIEAGEASNDFAGYTGDLSAAQLQYVVSGNIARQLTDAQAEADKKAAEERDKLAEAQRQLNAQLGDYFVTALNDADGGMGFFNESLAEMSDRTVYHSNLTGQQWSDLQDLQDAYNKTADEIHDYDLGLKGTNLSEEDRAKKLEELNGQLGVYGEKLSELNSVGGYYTEVAGSMTINQDALNQAVFDAADSQGASAEQLAILGGALGLYSEDAVEAALQTALIQAKIDELTAAYIAGDISVGDMRTELQAFVEQVQAVPTDFTVTGHFVSEDSQWNPPEGGTPSQAGGGGSRPGGKDSEYAMGGYTGAGGLNEVAGLVHRGELVIPSSALRNGMSGIMDFAQKNIPGGAADSVAPTVNIYMYGTRATPQAVASEVSRVLAPKG